MHTHRHLSYIDVVGNKLAAEMMLQRQSWMAVVLLMLSVSPVRGVGAAAHWGDFKSDNCVMSGYRKYYSRLWGISGDWNSACLSTTARVGPQQLFFQKPDNCVDKGIGGIWGEFLVRDTTCDPNWGSFQDDGCTASTGYRQYSSVLHGIQGDWDAWCADTPATVRGILFLTPSRCVKSIFNLNIWGEFDVDDPCCPSSSPGHDDLRRRSPPGATCVSGGGGGGGDDDKPPFNPNSGHKISSAADAISALRGNYNPLDLVEYLWNAIFQSLVTGTEANAVDFYAIEFNSFNPPIIRFQPNPSANTPSARIRALLVPTIAGSSLTNNGGVFPAGMFATIDLANPPAPIICTQQLSGCCMAFGWNNNNGRLYMGHIEPDETVPAISRGEDLANYVRTQPIFPEAITSLTAHGFFGYGGQRPEDSYPLVYRVNIVGFITGDSIRIFFQVIDANRNIVRRRMLEFRRV